MFPRRPRSTARPMAPLPSPCEQLTRLVYELLDAHDDTARIAAGQNLDVHWQAHLSYLRDLQRVGREVLARAGHQEERRPSMTQPASGASSPAAPTRPLPSEDCEPGSVGIVNCFSPQTSTSWSVRP
jgi:hypothetical protein